MICCLFAIVPFVVFLCLSCSCFRSCSSCFFCCSCYCWYCSISVIIVVIVGLAVLDVVAVLVALAPASLVRVIVFVVIALVLVPLCFVKKQHRRSNRQCDKNNKATGARCQKVTKATKAKQAESHTNWKSHKSNNPFPSVGHKKDSKLYLPYTYHGEGKSEGCLRRHVAVRAVVTLIDIQKDCLRSDSNAQGDIRDMLRLMLDEVIITFLPSSPQFMQIIVGYERHAKSLHIFST